MSKVNKKNIGPEAFEALDKLADEVLAKQAQKGKRVTASEAIERNHKAEPYTVRLTARELFRLKMMSEMEGAKPSELARRLILTGLMQLEALHVEASAEQDQALQELYRMRNKLVHMVDSIDQAIAHASEVKTIEKFVPELSVTFDRIEEARAEAQHTR